MRMRTITTFFVVLCTMLLAGQAFATLIDFETGPNLNSQYPEITFDQNWIRTVSLIDSPGFAASVFSPCQEATISFASPVNLVSFDYASLSIPNYYIKATLANDILLTLVDGTSFVGIGDFIASSQLVIKELIFSSGIQQIDNLNIQATPIPATLWLLVSGLLGMIGLRRFF